MTVGPPTPLRSALYEGIVTHRRAEPAHRFDSPVALPLLFLDELAELRAVHPLVDFDPSPHRRRWPTAIRFHRDDYLPSDAATVRGAVEDAVAAAGGSVRGPVAMLGHVRTWGWLFNPLTLYYCFDPSGRRWSGRCSRCPTPPGTSAAPTSSDPRESTTSPRPCTSHPSCRRRAGTPCATPAPEDGIRVSLDVAAPPPSSPYGRLHEPDPAPTTPELAATMVLRRRPLDRAGLARLLWRHPFMTTRVSGGIYAQALRLVARGAPIHRHPGPPEPARPARRRVH